MVQKNQSDRLTSQHKKSKGVDGIFGEEAKQHDDIVSNVEKKVMELLKKHYPQLSFRYRSSIEKKEINAALKSVDSHYMLNTQASFLTVVLLK